MSRGRRVPPAVVIDAPAPNTDGYRRAMEEDEQFFLDNPTVTERRRPYIEGEAPSPMPPGTMVLVKRIGFRRVRSFEPGPVEGN